MRPFEEFFYPTSPASRLEVKENTCENYKELLKRIGLRRERELMGMGNSVVIARGREGNA